ncbi:MAG: DUF1684 domain-containing protein [Weeksellaceae bacterium]|nr:DUF1684 domain-containing protein [Weeksellaceae bacterium]
MKSQVFLWICTLIIFSHCSTTNVANQQALQEIREFQRELNQDYKDPEKTPLKGNNVSKFVAHTFFPVDLDYRLEAQLEIDKHSEPFDMETSSGRTVKYRKYGVAHFILHGKSQQLTIYQNLKNLESEEYKDFLFLPFKDETNGTDTYGGGRYINLTIPQSNTIIIDFNQAYNPYCAYTAFGYSCPLVPEENHLTVVIPAGVKYEHGKWYDE